eukprot:ANDGO_05431.mRNA.1 Cationic amino acid transporter 4
MIGAGIFVISGIVAKEKAGPGVVLSYLFAGICAMLNALAYAEFAARIPVSGSSYLYAYTSVGELTAFILSFQLILEYTVGASVVARGWTAYVDSITGHAIPTWFISIPLNDWFEVNLLAPIVILLLVALICFGASESATVNNIVTAVIIVAIVFAVSAGSSFVNLDNYSPFLPFGMGGVFSGSASVFFSFLGFDAISCCAEEVKNPKRDLPLGIIASLSFTTVLYCALSFVLVGMVSYADIDIEAPLASAFDSNGATWAKYIVSIGALSGLTTTVLVLILSQPRIYMGLARDGLLYEWFSKVHPRFNTPVNGTLFTGMVCIIFATFLRIEILADLVSIGTLFAFALVSASVLILRFTEQLQSREQDHDSAELKKRKRRSLHLFYWSFPTLIVTLMIASNLLIHELYIPGAVFGTVSFALTLFIWRIPIPESPTKVSKVQTFQCPASPFVPIGAVFSSMYLMFSLDLFTWIRFLGWTVLGFIFYFSYSMRHSKLNARL